MRLLVVIVLYRVTPHDSKTFRSLMAAYDSSRSRDFIDLLVYDNSPMAAALNSDCAVKYRYLHNPSNGGLSAAYNAGLSIANSENIEWMLLLDQDTCLPVNYISRLTEIIASNLMDIHTAAVVPRLISNGVQISPTRVRPGWRLTSMPNDFVGCIPFPFTALNSGAAIRVSFMNLIAGFNNDFKLDYLDHWMFRSIQQRQFRVYALNDCLHHDLSVMDFGRNVGVARYSSILNGEFAFFKYYGTRIERFVHLFRLTTRYLRQHFKNNLRGHAKMTRGYLFKQLLIAIGCRS